MKGNFSGHNFSFIDIETTGFSPKRGDKIIEIGIVNTDHQGNIINTYETLINPRRDIGATWVHGISSDMVLEAPLIQDIVDDILEQIDGNVIVCPKHWENSTIGRILFSFY